MLSQSCQTTKQEFNLAQVGHTSFLFRLAGENDLVCSAWASFFIQHFLSIARRGQPNKNNLCRSARRSTKACDPPARLKSIYRDSKARFLATTALRWGQRYGVRSTKLSLVNLGWHLNGMLSSRLSIGPFKQIHSNTSLLYGA